MLSVFALLSNMKNIFIIVKQERESERLKIQLIYINRNEKNDVTWVTNHHCL